MKPRLLLRLFTVISALHTLVAGFEPRYNETSLILRDLFANYDARVLPFSNGPVVINMTVVLGILIELRENEQLAAFVISHTQRWYDKRLTWNPSFYRGQNQVIVPQSLVWLPKMFVYNSLETKEMLTSNRADVRVYSDGLVKANLPQHVSCICRLSIENFPFDVQFCAVALASPLLTVQEMMAASSQPPADSYFAGNAEWLLFNVTVRQMEFREEDEYRIEVHYIFHMQRRPVYYLTVIVAPTFLISALSILGIFSPASNDGPRSEKRIHDNGRTQTGKVSLGLGSLLAMTVLLGIVAGAMPKSNVIPLLGYYILIVICLCAVAVAISMAFLAITREYITRGQPPSRSTLSFLWMKRMEKKGGRLVRVAYSRCNNNVAEVQEKIKFKVPELGAIHSLLEEILETQRAFRLKEEARMKHREIEEQWATVFARFDYFFLFLFEAFNLAALGIFLRAAWEPMPELREQLL